MADLLKAAADMLATVRTSYLATENAIVYIRANSTEISLSGVVIAAYRQDEDAVVEASTLMTERRDFIIPVSELTGGEPVDGETIKETQGSTSYLYTVTGEFGEKSWEWHDRSRSAYRVHTIFKQSSG